MEKKHTRLVWPVEEPFQIAYKEPITGILKLRPYIELQWKMKIWGIAFANMVFKLTHEPGKDWQGAMNCVDEKCRAFLASTADLDLAYAHKEGFDKIVDFLQAHKVSAERWHDGWYWSKEDNGDEATVVDMQNGRAELISKHIKNGYVRLVSRRIASNANLTVHDPLVYLHNGKFEVSYTLDLQRKD